MVDRALAALNARGNTLTVAPTGAGKTIILSAVAGRLGGKQCVLQHRDELVTQNLRKYRAVNPGRSVGMFTADAKSWRAETTFAMVQTLQRNLASLPKLDALIIDEAHHAVANGYLKIVEAVREKNPACRIFGVTATPARGDGKGLREVFDNCADQISLHSLVSMGFLVRPRTYICTLTGTDEKLASLRKMHNGEYDMHEAAQILDVAVHNEAVVREWRKLAGERKTIVFCSTVEHARHVLDAFLAAGVRAAMVTGEMPPGARKAMLESFDAAPAVATQEATDGDSNWLPQWPFNDATVAIRKPGKPGNGYRQDAPNGVQVLINVAVLTEGYDSQPVSCVVLLRPCSQKSTMLQMIGRGLRTVDPAAYPGVVKKDCIVLDFGRSLLTHGDLESKVRIDDRQKGLPGMLRRCALRQHGMPHLRPCVQAAATWRGSRPGCGGWPGSGKRRDDGGSEHPRRFAVPLVRYFWLRQSHAGFGVRGLERRLLRRRGDMAGAGPDEGRKGTAPSRSRRTDLRIGCRR